MCCCNCCLLVTIIMVPFLFRRLSRLEFTQAMSKDIFQAALLGAFNEKVMFKYISDDSLVWLTQSSTYTL